MICSDVVQQQGWWHQPSELLLAYKCLTVGFFFCIKKLVLVSCKLKCATWSSASLLLVIIFVFFSCSCNQYARFWETQELSWKTEQEENRTTVYCFWNSVLCRWELMTHSGFGQQLCFPDLFFCLIRLNLKSHPFSENWYSCVEMEHSLTPMERAFFISLWEKDVFTVGSFSRSQRGLCLSLACTQTGWKLWFCNKF